MVVPLVNLLPWRKHCCYTSIPISRARIEQDNARSLCAYSSEMNGAKCPGGPILPPGICALLVTRDNGLESVGDRPNGSNAQTKGPSQHIWSFTSITFSPRLCLALIPTAIYFFNAKEIADYSLHPLILSTILLFRSFLLPQPWWITLFPVLLIRR